MPYLSPDEARRYELELVEMVKVYPSIPYIKKADEARELLRHGRIDFIVATEYWDHKVSTPPPFTIIRRATAWGRAEIGFIIRGRSIEELIDAIGYVITSNPQFDFIYFRCLSPDIPPPRISVDEDLAEYNMILEQVRRGYIDDRLYDV